MKRIILAGLVVFGLLSGVSWADTVVSGGGGSGDVSSYLSRSGTDTSLLDPSGNPVLTCKEGDGGCATRCDPNAATLAAGACVGSSQCNNVTIACVAGLAMSGCDPGGLYTCDVSANKKYIAPTTVNPQDTSNNYSVTTAQAETPNMMFHNFGWDGVNDASPQTVTGVAMSVNSGWTFTEKVTDTDSLLSALTDPSGNAYYRDPSTNTIVGPCKEIYKANGKAGRMHATVTFPKLGAATGLSWLVGWIQLDATVDSKFYCVSP